MQTSDADEEEVADMVVHKEVVGDVFVNMVVMYKEMDGEVNKE